MPEQPQSFGLLCAIEIVKAKREAQASGRTFMRSDVAAIIDRMDAARPKAKRQVRETPYSKMTDEEFIAALESEPHLQGLDVRRELGKAQFWARANNREATRRFLINWLHKADAALVINGTGQSSRKVAQPESPPEPAGWREWVRNNTTNTSWADGSWDALYPEAKKYILGELSK